MCCIDKKVDANDRDAMVKVWADVMECSTLRQSLFLRNGKMNAPLFIYNTGLWKLGREGQEKVKRRSTEGVSIMTPSMYSFPLIISALNHYLTCSCHYYMSNQ